MRVVLAFTLAVGACLFNVPAYATVTMNVEQVGDDVVASTTGTLDQAGLTWHYADHAGGGAQGSGPGYIGTGLESESRVYSGFTGPSSFGAGSNFVSASFNDWFGFAVSTGEYGISVFTSHEGEVFGSSTFLNQTFATLGLTPGTYVFTSSADHIFVNIGAPVPEPATWELMLLGFGLLGYTMRRKPKASLSALT
jgi:hypothetical protein